MNAKTWLAGPFALVAGAGAYIWSQYEKLPAEIPVHYGLHGADKWAAKSAMTVLAPAGVGLAVLAIMAVKAGRLEGGALWKKVALAWVVGLVLAVVTLLPLFGGGGEGGL